MDEFYQQQIEEEAAMHNAEMERDYEESLLETRGSTHGEFTDNAEFVQLLKHQLRDTPKWNYLKFYQMEALDMIAHKIARILYGDPKFIDSWRDIKGYTDLVVDRLTVDKDASDVKNVKIYNDPARKEKL